MGSSQTIRPVSPKSDNRVHRLLDTSDRSDATLCGYDAPCDPNDGDDGLLVTQAGDWITIQTAAGEVTLSVQEARVMASVILPSAQAGRRAA